MTVRAGDRQGGVADVLSFMEGRAAIVCRVGVAGTAKGAASSVADGRVIGRACAGDQ